MRERETYSLWAYQLTKHVLFVCPKSLNSFASNLFKQLSSELLERISRTQREFEDDRYVLQRHNMLQIISAIFEGSWISDKTLPLCHAQVLEHFLPIMYRLRQDLNVMVRCGVLDMCARLIGMKSRSNRNSVHHNLTNQGKLHFNSIIYI